MTVEQYRFEPVEHYPLINIDQLSSINEIDQYYWLDTVPLGYMILLINFAGAEVSKPWQPFLMK